MPLTNGNLPRTTTCSDSTGRASKAGDSYVERSSDVVHIPVKTRVGPLSLPTSEVISRPDRFYALVHYNDLNSSSLTAPAIYLVPSETVKSAVELHSACYLRAHPKQMARAYPVFPIHGAWTRR